MSLVERLRQSASVFGRGYIPADSIFDETVEVAALLHEAADALEQRWIPCDERLPERGSYVLAWSELAGDELVVFDAEGEWRGSGDPEGITLWAPLPPPPPGREE